VNIDQQSVLIVSRNSKMIDFIKTAMPPDRFSPIHVVTNASEARRLMLVSPADIVVINTPLPDEFGTKLAQDLSNECAVAVIVKPELLERASYKLEALGIVTLPSTLYKTVLYQSLMLLSASVTKLKRLSKERDSLTTKLKEVRVVMKAKALLISEKFMTEDEAHRYIEKKAMDSGRKKAEVAAQIIKELSDEDY